MTEDQWPVCPQPESMLKLLRGRASDRKLRLFACACSRRVWPRLSPDERRAVELAEEVAEGRLDSAAVELPPWGTANRRPWSFFLADAFRVAEEVCHSIPDDFRLMRGKHDERWAQAELLDDIFGNPFRPATIEPAWLTSTVVALAGRVYMTRDFTPMPILADALQDAGCSNEEVLNHCQGGAVHARGCWVVDVLLGQA
jgi:hypothetical protein